MSCFSAGTLLDLSPMEELLETHFPEEPYTPTWSDKCHLSDDLASEADYQDLENILAMSQTRLDLDLEPFSPASSGPQSPQLLPDSNEHISDDDLIKLPIRELNKRIRHLSKEEVKKIRKRRRSLKNRGYATSCRQRRVALKETLETQNQRLKAQLREAKEKLNIAIKDRDIYKEKCGQLQDILLKVRCIPHS